MKEERKTREQRAKIGQRRQQTDITYRAHAGRGSTKGNPGASLPRECVCRRLVGQIEHRCAIMGCVCVTVRV